MARVIFWIYLLFFLTSCQTVTHSSNTHAAELNIQLGYLYLNQNERVLSKSKFLKALSLAPDFPHAHLGIADFFKATQQFKEADKEYRLALSLSKNSPLIQARYAEFLCQQGQQQEAKMRFQQAINQGDASVQLFRIYQKALECAQLGGDRELVAVYERQVLLQTQGD